MKRRPAVALTLGLVLLIANAARDPSWSAGRAPFGPYIIDRTYPLLRKITLDEPDELLTWARTALAAAGRVAAKRGRAAPRRTSRPQNKGQEP